MTRDKRPPLKQAEALDGLLQKLLGEKGFNERLSRYQAWLVWDKVVGEKIAQRARPLRIREKTLEVRVDHPVWMQQLQMLKPQILAKIRQQLPDCDIEEIYLRRGTPKTASGAEPTPPAVDWRRENLSAEEEKEIEKRLAGLQDPDLKEELRRLLIRQSKLDKARNPAD